MYIHKLPNAAASKISVTSTATELLDLIQAAASASIGIKSHNLNAVDIVVEDGDVRVLFDGNTPTATNGILLSSGVMYGFRGVPLTTMKLIRVGGSDVACSVQVGQSEPSESSFATAYYVTLEASGITIGGIEGDIAHDAVDSGNPVKIGFNAQDPTAPPAAVSVADRVNGIADLFGRIQVYLATRLDSVNDSIAAHIGASADVTGLTMVFDSDGDNTAQALNINPGNVYKLVAVNGGATLNSAVSYIQLFNAAVGSVTVGTTTPDYVIPVPASGFTFDDNITPLSFPTAATYACTTTPTGSGDPTNGLTLSFGIK